MEEIVELLESLAKDVDGTKMVTLSAAIAAVQTAKHSAILEELRQATLSMQQLTGEFESTQDI